MTKPAILAVDADPTARGEVELALKGRYGNDYRIICMGSEEEALACLKQLSDAGDQVALVLATNELDQLPGRGLLERVWDLHPHAKRALLVPWLEWGERAVGEGIFESMALGRVDYFVLTPADPSDERFHHAISGFLLEWTKARHTAAHTVHVVGESWAGRAYELRETLQRCAVPHAFHLAQSDEGRELIARTDRVDGGMRLPIIALPDGRVLVDPSNVEIAEAVGATVDPEDHEFDVVIVGAGPAGLSAAVNAASEGLRTIVIDEGGIGGQATSSSLIRNYLGFPRGISGGQLAEQAYDQAWVFGTAFAFMQRVEGIERSGDRVVLTLPGQSSVSARAVVLAMGASYRRLGVPALEALTGAGVFYGGPVSEAQAMAGKNVYIVGGANSAGQAALHLARYARSVTLVVRAQSLGAGMSRYLVRELEATPNIHVRLGSAVVDGGGDGHLQRLVLRGPEHEQETAPADGLFILIGARPNTGWVAGEIARDRHEFLLTGADLPEGSWPLERAPLPQETSMPGVFAAGDVRHGAVKRVGSAVGEGGIAIQQVHRLFALERLHPGTALPGPVAHGAAG